MFIKIYFDDKPLFLCDNIDDPIKSYAHHDDTVYIDELNLHTVKSMIHEMEQSKIHAGIFYHSDLDVLKKTFFKKFSVVRAGGGLIRNDDNNILLIFRRGKWDLPKGKLDKGETLEDCAIREVKEETGLTNVSIKSPLLVTYHTYREGTKFIMKESHWYLMKATGKQELVPQTEEDIQEIKWVEEQELRGYFKNTFPSIVDVLEAIRPS
jgi:8-oxo-dGTP pyrophosphatase MutT (NUDIX family)